MEHLDNIINDINLIKKAGNYNLKQINIDFLEKNIIELKNMLINSIDLAKVDTTAKIIYQLNLDNSFSDLTDHISNEFYAFEFMLERKIKEEKYNGRKN